MWKEIAAPASAYHDRDEPAPEKSEPFALAGNNQRDQTGGRQNPSQRFCSREPGNGFRTKLKPIRPGHRADVFQVVGDHVVDQLAQSTTHPEVKTNDPGDREQPTSRPKGECE